MLSSLQQKAGLRPLTTNAWGMLYGSLMLATYCMVRGIPFEMDWSARYVGALCCWSYTSTFEKPGGARALGIRHVLARAPKLKANNKPRVLRHPGAHHPGSRLVQWHLYSYSRPPVSPGGLPPTKHL